MEITKEQREKIQEIAEKHGLKFVILYGSQATGRAREKSDIDIAILGERRIDFKKHIDLIGEFTGLFQTDEIDVKLLHSTNPLFRYEVTRIGKLLFGNEHDYVSYQAFAFRDYMDSQSLFKLKNIIIKKRMEYLLASNKNYGK